jgi:HEAT repeat protein
MRIVFPLIALSLGAALATGQQTSPDNDPKERIRLIRELAKKNGEGIPGIAAYVRDPDLDVRLETVQRLSEISGPRTLSALATLCADPDPEIQLNAIDGIVNIYLPGYLKSGISRSVKRSADGIKVRFNDPGDLVVDGYVNVSPEAISAISSVLRDSKSLDAKASAARALGILRANPSVKDLTAALYSKDDQLMYESLVSLQKIRDASAGPAVAFLVRDLNPKVQIASLQAAGILRSKQAAPGIRTVISDGGNSKVAKEAVDALAKIADPPDRELFTRLLSDKDAVLRTAAAEGLGRIRNASDIERLNQVFEAERDTSPRMAEAFALVSLGRLEMNELSPFRYLVSGLNRSSLRTLALAYLAELTREPAVRQTLYPTLSGASKDEKTGMCQVFGESGERDSVPYLNVLKDEKDTSVALTCLAGLRTLEARLR